MHDAQLVRLGQRAGVLPRVAQGLLRWQQSGQPLLQSLTLRYSMTRNPAVLMAEVMQRANMRTESLEIAFASRSSRWRRLDPSRGQATP